MMKEADLYPPVKRFLESLGYEVKGEVQDSDVVAMRNGERADSLVNVLVDPSDYRPCQSKQGRERLLGELIKRVVDPNCGGKDKRTGIMTAHRQRVLAVAQFLQSEGPTKAATVAAALDEPKAREEMYRDVYGWFDRTSVGVHEISPLGKQEI